jgi:uncharacterized protein (DUF1330 family)
MTAFVVFIRYKTTDPAGMEKYGAIARTSPAEKITLIAAKTCPFEVLEGPPAEAVAILSFPTWDDAKEWYDSEAYTEARKYRQASAEVRGYLVEGVA